MEGMGKNEWLGVRRDDSLLPKGAKPKRSEKFQRFLLPPSEYKEVCEAPINKLYYKTARK